MHNVSGYVPSANVPSGSEPKTITAEIPMTIPARSTITFMQALSRIIVISFSFEVDTLPSSQANSGSVNE